ICRRLLPRSLHEIVASRANGQMMKFARRRRGFLLPPSGGRMFVPLGRALVSTSDSVPPAGRFGVEATHLVPNSNHLAIRLDAPAFVDDKFAARCERAPRRQVAEVRWTPWNGRQ